MTGIVDMWPELLRPVRRKFTAGLCLLLFALGVPMVTQVCIGRCFVKVTWSCAKWYMVTFSRKVEIKIFINANHDLMQGGAYIFQLMDFYGASGIPILWCCFFQTIAIGWIFGVNKFAGCVEQMTGFKPNT